LEAALRAIADKILQTSSPSREDVHRIKMEVCKAYRLNRIPGNAEIIRILRSD